MLKRHRLELSAAITIAVLALLLGLEAPAFFTTGNLSDVLMANVPVLLVAVGATMVMVAGGIDISVGSAFAVCSVVSGALAAAGVPIPLAALAAPVMGAALGAMNGMLVAYLRVPSIVATLAAMVVLRDGLRWITQGAWIQGLPAGFQWLGLGQRAFPAGAACFVGGVTALAAWSLHAVKGGRAVYAIGSHPEAARLYGIDVSRTRLGVFAVAGTLTGLAALVNTARFSQVPSNTGLGLEMKVIAAVVVGGTAIRGGRGTIAGTLLGVTLLGMIGPALTFLGVNVYWERALQGTIILGAISFDAVRAHRAGPARAARPSDSLDALA